MKSSTKPHGTIPPYSGPRKLTILEVVKVLTLMGLALTNTFAGDFTFYSVGKGLYYSQTLGGSPVLKSPLPWLFCAQVVSESESNFVSSAEVRSVSGSPSLDFPLQVRLPFGVVPLVGISRYADQAALNAAYPDGPYEFTIHTRHESPKEQTVGVELVNGAFPPAPEIANLPAAQGVNAANDFTLTWEPFAGAKPADFIFFQLQRTGLSLFHSAYVPETPDALNGTNTWVTIPGGTLAPGRAYLGRLVFAYAQTTFTNAYPGAWGTAFLFSQTDFWIRTQGSNDNTPPAVIRTSPNDGAVGVPTNTPIAFEFSEPMNLTNVSITVVGKGGLGPYISPLVWNSDGDKLVMGPGRSFEGKGWCAIILNALEHGLGFRDLSGNPLAADTVLAFTAGLGQLTPIPGLFTNARRDADGAFRLSLKGELNWAYTLQYSEDFTNWFNLCTNIAFWGAAEFTDTNTEAADVRVYRAIAH